MKPQEIVEVIEKILKERGISKGDFYAACGINSAVFSHWRKNENYPAPATLELINKFLGVSFGISLLDDTEKTATPEGDGGAAEVMELFNSLDPAGRAALLADARALAAARKSQDNL